MTAAGSGYGCRLNADPRYDGPKLNRPGLACLNGYYGSIAAQQPMLFLADEKHLDLFSNRMHGVDGFSDGALIVPDTRHCNGFVLPK